MKDSITTEEAGYQKIPADEIGSYEGEVNSAANNYTSVNRGFNPAEVPTPENSKRKGDVSQLPVGLDSAPNIGNLSC